MTNPLRIHGDEGIVLTAPYAFGVVYGLDWVASGPLTVRLLSGVVGAERLSIMVAWITVIHQIGSASAA